MDKKLHSVSQHRKGFDVHNSNLELSFNCSREELDPYVPADHRPIESNTSTLGALAHLLKASLSSGVLAMPLAFKNVGLLVGSLGTIVVGFICTHSIYILVRTSQQLCVETKRPCLGFAETCELVFRHGPVSVRKYAYFVRELSDWILAVIHLGACCVYVVIIAETFKQISEEYGGPHWSVVQFCALTLVILMPLSQITKLKYLVPFSALANLVWLATICVSVYYCLRDPPDISQRPLATSITGVPNFISTCLFAMEGIGVVMPLENEMIKPQHFLGCPGVLNIAMTIVVILYGFMGFTGYLKYGEAVRGSITLNLPQDEILSQSAKVLVACVLILSYALIFYVPVDVVWRRLQLKIPPKNHKWGLSGLRLFLSLLSVGIACAVPRLELFMELVGALCLSIMGLLIPALIEIVWRWDKSLGFCYWVVWKNIIIILFSLVALVSGSTYAIISLLETF